MIVYLKNQSDYKMKDFEGMSYDEIRPIFEKIWDFKHNFVPMDLGYDRKRRQERLQDVVELYRLVKERYSSSKPEGYDFSIALGQNQRDLPKDIPLGSVVVLRYEKRNKSENKGKMMSEIELVLEQTQQGTSYEVSVSAKGVEKLKRKVKIKGEKKEALLTLRQKPGFLDSLMNIKKDGYTCFSQQQEQYEHVGPEVTRSQEGKRSQDDDKRLCLVDDLQEVLNHIHIKSKIQVKA
ncbi:hypothetical protein Tco_0937970 [Tanacetum coccineum]|uniref:Uncharacterized protein n=1 Tax=Tanacetum coccineum TaxID=301880 RepID=A0ABQ5DFS8_9ASTR